MVTINKDSLAYLNAGKDKPVKKNKYKNTRTEADGIKFQSIKEKDRYFELKLMQHAGIISDLELQPKHILQEKFTYMSKPYPQIAYFADFRYKRDGKVWVEDVKAWDKKKKKFITTDVFEIKKKMLLKKYPDINFRLF